VQKIPEAMVSELLAQYYIINDAQQCNNNFMPCHFAYSGAININNNATQYNNISKNKSHPDQCSH
jgi:hypothetical protein